MKHELVKWLCIELDMDMVMGSNLGRSKLSFPFAKLIYGKDKKGWEPSSHVKAAKGAGKTTNDET